MLPSKERKTETVMLNKAEAFAYKHIFFRKNGKSTKKNLI